VDMTRQTDRDRRHGGESAGRAPVAEGMTFREVVRLLWSRLLLLVCCAIVLAIIGVVIAWVTPPKYEAKVLLVPVTNNSQESQLGGLSSLASQFGGLASLAGINLEGNTKKAEYTAFLESETLTQKYIADNDLLPILYAKKWDPAAKRWKVTDPKKVPTLWQANRYFKNSIRTVATEQKTGLVTMTISWKNPRQAAEWANGLVKMANDYLRDQAITESERNISYLTGQAAKTDQVGIREVIYSILQTEISKVMLARGNEQYAFTVVDPAFVPEKPSSLGKKAWAAIGFLGGLLLGAAYVIGRQGFVGT